MKFDDYSVALAEEISILTQELRKKPQTEEPPLFYPALTPYEKAVEREAKLDDLIMYILLNSD